jgi:hypothetical protein
MNAKQALAWVKKCGIAVESARANVPSLAQVVAREPLRGSCGHIRKGTRYSGFRERFAVRPTFWCADW